MDRQITQSEIDDLTGLVNNIRGLVNDIENNLYSSGDPIDENAASLRMYAMNKLIDNIDGAVEFLQGEVSQHEQKAKTKTTRGR